MQQSRGLQIGSVVNMAPQAQQHYLACTRKATCWNTPIAERMRTTGVGAWARVNSSNLLMGLMSCKVGSMQEMS
eukprot:1141188-Pelagomonas_calceolata.AAC.3